MRKQPRWYYLIDRRQLDDTPSHAVLDMLRYDGAMVESNGPDGYWMFSSDSAPKVERWKSFGIKVEFAGNEYECRFYNDRKVGKA